MGVVPTILKGNIGEYMLLITQFISITFQTILMKAGYTVLKTLLWIMFKGYL